MPIIIILLLILIILFICVFCYMYIKKKITIFSKNLFGTTNIIDGLKQQELEYNNTPKSVSSLDSIVIPCILKDFPNLDTNELLSMVKNTIFLSFKSLEEGNIKNIENMTSNFINKLNSQIDTIKKEKKKYSQVKIHKIVFNSYENKKGICRIICQSSIEYIEEKNKTKKKVQKRINTTIIYIYDEIKANSKYGISLNCSNCGAPIKKLGVKSCPYCGTGIIDYVSKTWKIDDIDES